MREQSFTKSLFFGIIDESLLFPWPEPEFDDVSAVIRRKVATGLLPKHAPVKVWAGYGSGKKCDACELPTSTAGIEYEVDMADHRTFLFHEDCLTAWHQERAVYLADGSR